MNKGVIVKRESTLLQIIDALSLARGFPRRLHGWQQQRDQNRNNENRDQHFDQGESAPDHSLTPREWTSARFYSRPRPATTTAAVRVAAWFGR
jgi:hypothetical protein